MAMKVATFNGCKVYNLASGKTIPQWLTESKKRALAKDEDYRKRVELIQDFEMATASQTMKMTADGEHIIVAGTYPPVVKCYTVSDMALKFQRGLTCEVVTFETLSEDFGKLVFLRTDRTLNFHAPYGTHYSVRVPKFGRDLVYGWFNCDLYVAGSGDEVYRLNLESGQFKEPFQLSYTGCNKMHINPVHNLLACGGETAACEFWDPRTRRAVAKLTVDKDPNVEISSLKFDTDGLTLGVGTSNGNCLLYDIRSSNPLFVKEHQYELPVIDVTFHNSSKHVISTDKKVVKIWERHEPNQGRVMTNIETPCDINGLWNVSDRRGQTGMLMLAGEQSRMMVYYVPQLGPAPRWCSYLEGLTEELEETSGTSVYEDFKFITRQEVEEMGATALIGTPMLRGYMHGFFVEMKLYNKLRAMSKPFEYEEHRKKKIQAKIEEKRQSRIIAQKRLPKVNKELAEKLLRSAGKNKNKGGGGEEDGEEEEAAKGGREQQAGGKGKGIIDPRFAALFEREEFERDETSDEFKLRNPNKGRNQQQGKGRDGGDSDDELQDLYQPVDDADDDEDEDDYYSDGDGEDFNRAGSDDSDLEIRADYEDYDSDDGNHKKNRGNSKKSGNKRKNRSGEDSEEEGEIMKASRRAMERMQMKSKLAAKEAKRDKNSQLSGATSKSSSISNMNRGRLQGDTRRSSSGPRMYEIADGVSSSKVVFSHTEESKQRRQAESSIGAVPLLDRLSATQKGTSSASSASGSRTGSRGKHTPNTRDDGDEENLNKVKYIRTNEEGLVRTMSYVPKETKSSKGRDRDRSSASAAEAGVTGKGAGGKMKGMGSRDDRERAAFF